MSDATQSGTMSPLPKSHRSGLISLAAISFIAFLSTALLWLFITYKLLVTWDKRLAQRRRENRQHSSMLAEPPDFSVWLHSASRCTNPLTHVGGLNSLAGSRGTPTAQSGSDEARDEEAEEAHNPFPTLIYNHILAEIMEAFFFGLSCYWVVRNGIFTLSPVCWAQGWLGSTSNLATTLFSLTITVHMFLIACFGYESSPLRVYTWTIGVWMFGFGINFTAFRVSTLHPTAGMASFYSTRSESRGGRSRHQSGEPQFSRYHPAFLIFPFIHIACSLPLAVGRIASLFGLDLGVNYFTFAGSVLAINGIFNAAIWTSTIVFSKQQEVHGPPSNKCAFVRTPAREFGHMVVVYGPASPPPEFTKERGGKQWWWWKDGCRVGWRRSRASASNPFDTHLEQNVPMDVVAAVGTESAGSYRFDR
ncbi:hypothetical protein CCHL11_00147 [Colletotrichum chlorophyti]|uniref:Uncharacterized protein n=1 Tax=Colletotrichum chlorophyti TaxID=708187 RepID=A0A1Q8RU07_9PEZI|nr:hypothetical protein CCHL11_00147 [Colletotrichum chlorophyti]